VSDEIVDPNWQKRWDVLWRVWISHTYHRKRERFFDTWDRIFKAVAVIGGSAALAKLGNVPAFKDLGGPEALAWIALGITVTSTISLVFGFAEKARRHADLASQFKKMEADIYRAGDSDFSDAEAATWQARVAEIEVAEPATLYALTQLCERELNIAKGHPERGPKLSLFKRLFAQLWSFSPPTAPVASR